MLKYYLLTFSFIAALDAQIGRISRLPPQLTQYMEFTQEQVNRIGDLNDALGRYQLEKSFRTSTVYSELAVETAKTPVDPMALGLRHLELESIRRELKAESEKTAAEIQKLLTPAQKTKLEALQQAMRLQGIGCEAQSVNLLGPIQNPYFQNVLPGNRWFDTSAFLLSPSCGIRTGDFTFNPILRP